MIASAAERASLELGVVGNGNFGALVDDRGRLCWCCLPGFDGEPAFCSLMGPVHDEAGYFDVVLENCAGAKQTYLENSAVLVTELHDHDGGFLEILDFAPRYRLHERIVHPVMLIRRLRVVAGTPRVRVLLRPLAGWGARRPNVTSGSNHVRYELDSFTLRATTDMPLPALRDGYPIIVERDLHVVLAADESLPHGIGRFVREQLDLTLHYWRDWVRNLATPVEWQEAVIRAAITLKLCQDEGCGAIVAGLTTSIPTPGVERSVRDARCCWLGDAAHVVRAFNRLGATRSMEEHLRFVFNVATAPEELRSVYGLQYTDIRTEHKIDSLAGYGGVGPVVSGVAREATDRRDSLGGVVLAASQLFFDRRIERGNLDTFARLEPLGVAATRRCDEPDVGWWLDVPAKGPRTSTRVMCFAACDRLSRIALQLGRNDREGHWRSIAEHIRANVLGEGWNDAARTLVELPGSNDPDPTALRFANLGLLAGDDDRFVATVHAIGARLRRGSHILRAPGDGLAPSVASYWYVDALATTGRMHDARDLFGQLLAHRTRLGLVSEYVDAELGTPWGNFPDTRALVGLLGAAQRLSRRWEDVI